MSNVYKGALGNTPGNRNLNQPVPSQEPIVIRKATPTDLPYIQSILKAEYDKEADPARINFLLERNPATIAIQGGNALGIAYTSGFSTDILQLASIVVRKDYRGYGIGMKLAEGIEVQAEDYRAILASNHMVGTETDDPRGSGLSFFQKAGYRMVYSTHDTWIVVRRLFLV